MKKRLTINLSDEQHEQLVSDAGNRTLSEYGREKLLGKAGRAKNRIRKPKPDEIILARILMALGSSDLGPTENAPRKRRNSPFRSRDGSPSFNP